jgi:hypothetical protein
MTTPEDKHEPVPLEDDEGLSVLEISSIVQTQVYQLSGVMIPQAVVAAYLAILAEDQV